MKVLITGSTGLLGTDLIEVCSQENEVIALSSKHFNIIDLHTTRREIMLVKPDVVIHLAAFSDVDKCEMDKNAAFTVNSLGTRNVSIAAEEIGASILYVSTDYIYDGQKSLPYYEYDSANPLNIYGRSKYEGENFVRSICRKYYIVRTSWLFGFHGKNFVRSILELAKSDAKLKVVNDQVGSPTYTPDLASAINQLINSGCYGTYHITNNGFTSWYDFAKLILSTSKISNAEILPITTEELNRPALRPKNSMMEKFYWKLNGFKELRSYDEALHAYLKLL